MSDPIVDKYLTTTVTRKSMALIYGPPITGKTTGARTFPNPYIVDFDNNLPPGTPNVIPMWDETFVDKVKPRIAKEVPNRRDVLLIILADIASRLPKDSTIIVDSLTRVETTYNMQEKYEPQPRSPKTGELDGHAQFRTRLNYFDTLFTMLVSCPANVVFIVHQQQERSSTGDIIGQIKPSLMGQIGEKLPGYFPIVMQACRNKDKTTPDKLNYEWRVRPGPCEPARVPKPVTMDFIPQSYAKLAPLL